MSDSGEIFRNQEAAKITGEKIDFSFGENWKKYLDCIDNQTITEAEKDFKRIAGVETLEGQTFLDLGCGSGMNSLIAYRLKADRILSIDYDPNSVETAMYLRTRYADDERWEIKRGSVLEHEFMESLGTHSFVLSWGRFTPYRKLVGGSRKRHQASKTGGYVFYRTIQPQSPCSSMAEDQTLLQSLSWICKKSSDPGPW